jgi:hypothetical protein
VLGKPLLLERCRVQGEPKCRMPHLAWNLPPDHDIPLQLSPTRQSHPTLQLVTSGSRPPRAR